MDDFTLDLNIDFRLDKPVAGQRKNKSYYEMRGQGLDNLFLMEVDTSNEWGIPATEPMTDDLEGIEWVLFGERKLDSLNEDNGISFYVEDYKFLCAWNKPEKYIETFKKLKAVVSPDFSNYDDMPKVQQLWNTYRRQWLAKYWQQHGVKVVSSLSWAVGQIEDWTFAGIPKGTTVATSFSGNRINKKDGIRELIKIIEKLEPYKVYIKCAEKDEKTLQQAGIDFSVIPPYSGW